MINMKGDTYVHNITERSTSGSQTRRTKESLKESKNHEAGVVLDQRGGNGDNDEEEHGDDINRITTDARDFTQGRENERPGTVAENIERKTQRGLELTYTEGPHDTFCRGDYQGDAETSVVGPVMRVLFIVAIVPVHEDVAIFGTLWHDGDRLNLFHIMLLVGF
ncbi:hypothetical protein HG531_003290 [Fusarium graminearum]|nr:hypothetical protein HG531_003290 [Fusarium graminearum]